MSETTYTKEDVKKFLRVMIEEKAKDFIDCGYRTSRQKAFDSIETMYDILHELEYGTKLVTDEN